MRVGNFYGWEGEIPLAELPEHNPNVFLCQPLDERKINQWVNAIAQSLHSPSKLLNQISVFLAELIWLERQYVMILTTHNIEIKHCLTEEKIALLHEYLEAVERARAGAFLMYRMEASREKLLPDLAEISDDCK
jgi:hypothetical protein